MANRKDSKGRVLKVGESQRKDGTYMYRYTDIRGARQCVYAPDLHELRDKEKTIQRSLSDGVNYADGSITVQELTERYLSTKIGIRDSTKAGYELNLKIITRYDFSQLKIRNVKMSDAKLFVTTLYKDGISYGRIHYIRAILSPAFKMACEENCISKNPFSFTLSSVIPNDKNVRPALSALQQKDLIAFIKENPFYSKYFDMINVLLWTGLRISEYCGLTIDDIDFVNRKISVNKQLVYGQNRKLRIAPPKTKTSVRDIPITDKIYGSLKNLVNTARQSNIINAVDGYCDFIALKPNGKVQMYLDLDMLFKRIKKAYNKANPQNPIDNFSPHVLRHTFCTNMIDYGLDVKSLQYIMGHSNATITLNVYAHASYDNASRKIFDLIDGKHAV